MFNVDDFDAYPELHSEIKKINKYVRKERKSKLASIIEELHEFWEENTLEVPVTFILSVMIEEYPSLIDIELIEKIEPFLKSENTKLKLNSIIIIGFYVLHHLDSINQKYITYLMEFLHSEQQDIRENAYYFLKRISKSEPQVLCKNKTHLIKSFQNEIDQKNIGNLILLLSFLERCNDFNFQHLYQLRSISIEIIRKVLGKNESDLRKALEKLLNKIFPEIASTNFLDEDKPERLIESLKSLFIKRKYNFSTISKEQNINFSQFLESFKKSTLEEKEIFFYTKNRETQQTVFYELEKDKLFNFFDQPQKLSHEVIINEFSEILDADELKLFIKTLVKLGHIQGYLSEFYFYPSSYIISMLKNDLEKKGEIHLSNYNHLPLNYVKKLVKEIAQKEKYNILIGNEKTSFYSLSKIREDITRRAAKETFIDLKEFQTRLTDKSFIRLIKSLPKEYLTNFHKRTYWLTNIGKLKFQRELENAKIIGYFDVDRVSEKLKIDKLLIYDIFDTEVDERSGLWNEERTIFYYSRYLKDKIEKITKIQDKEQQLKEIESISQKLNINKEQILRKIAENTKSIGEEIKKKDQIKISEYLEKTGMDYDTFIDYLNTLNLNFLKKGDTLIFNPAKIENAKKKVKEFIKSESTSKEVISLGTYDINSQLMKEIIEQLQNSGDIKGVFYKENNEVKFYTEMGIKRLMLSGISVFSLHDLFLGKDLSDDEIDILLDIFTELRENDKLTGTFDEETLTFSSDEIIFAHTYMERLDKFEKRVNDYYDRFNREFQKIKKVLTKDSTIYPQEIKIVQDSINRINERYIHWRSDLDATITRINKQVLKEQGYSEKKYKSLSFMEDNLEQVRSFAEEERVKELMEGFKLWINLFNQIELKYQNIIFYQKRVLNNPDDRQANQKLRDLREELNLV
jgi:hypothetical protein